MRGTVRPSSITGRTAAAGGAALLLTLTGCSSTPDTGAASPRPAAEPTPSATPVPHGSAPEGAAPDGAGQSTRAGLAVAAHATGLFCRPTVSRSKWISDLDAELTLEAAAAYRTVDPARIPCRKVTGPAEAVTGDDYTQLVTVPTDAGRYRVTLSRSSPTASWLVFRITPEGRKR